MKYRIFGIALLATGLFACTAEQDVEPVISPDNKPAVTFTPSSSVTTLTEGDTLVYSIKTDKPIDRAVTFSAKINGGTAGEEDFTIESAVLQPYTTSVDMYIIANSDDMPEASETFDIEIGAYSIADRYLLNPTTVNPTASFTITNVNDPTLLTVVFEWPDEDTDIDIVVFSETEGEWSDQGATGHNPEVDKSIWLSDPTGTYYINIIDWDSDTFTYKFTIGHPDGTNEVIEGTFDTTDYSVYTRDNWTSWGGSYPSYRVLKVVNSGTGFTVTKL